MRKRQGTLSVAQAVKVINEEYGEHITRASLMAWLRSGRCPFGEYIHNTGKSKGAYFLFRGRMEEYFKPKHDVGRAVVDGLYIRQSADKALRDIGEYEIEPPNPKECFACFPNM